MATPLNQEAEEVRGFFARERRRKKQDQKDYDLAGFESAPFDVRSLSVNVGGANYAQGDQFSILGGTFYQQSLGYVVSETGGVVDSVAVLDPGKYTVSPGAGAATSAITGIGVGLTVDVILSGLFDFGNVPQGGKSPNGLILPASGFFSFVHAAATLAGDIAITDETTGIVYPSADPGQAGGRVNIRRLFPEVHQIKIAAAPTAPLGQVNIFFRGPKSQMVQIGQAVIV